VSVPVSVTVSVVAVLVMAKWMLPMSPLEPAWPAIESASEGLRSFSTKVALIKLVLSTSVTVRLGAIVTGMELVVGVPTGGSLKLVIAPIVTTGGLLTGVTLMVSVTGVLSTMPSLAMTVTVRARADGLLLVLK
jgi:hypothetical protein